MLADEQIRTRFSPDHYILLNNFGPEEAAEFTSALLQNWIDASKRAVLLQKHQNETDNESVADSSFPFTDSGLKIFVDYACRNGGITTPRDVQSSLETVLNRAIDDGRHVLSCAYMNKIASGS